MTTSGELKSLQSDKNKHLFVGAVEACYQIVSGAVNGQDDDFVEGESRTELDSHANMPVVGKNAFVLADTG